MNELNSGTSCSVKKMLNGTASCDQDCNYPSPYEMTKLNGGGGGGTGSCLRSLIDPHSEPMYATVKRTPRAPRNGSDNQHVYQYPLTLVSGSNADHCFDTDSCLSLTTSNISAPATTAFVRMHETDTNEKNLTGEWKSL